MKTISAHSKSTVSIFKTLKKIFISWHNPFKQLICRSCFLKTIEGIYEKMLTIFYVVIFGPALPLSLYFNSQLWVRYSYHFSLLLFLRSVLQVQGAYSSWRERGDWGHKRQINSLASSDICPIWLPKVNPLHNVKACAILASNPRNNSL